MYAEENLIQWLLFKDPERESNSNIAKKNGIKSETSVRKLRSGEASIENMKFKNAAAMTKYAEYKLHGGSETENKIQWLLDQYVKAGHEVTKQEIIKKAVDNYFNLAKGCFIDELNQK